MAIGTFGIVPNLPAALVAGVFAGLAMSGFFMLGDVLIAPARRQRRRRLPLYDGLSCAFLCSLGLIGAFKQEKQQELPPAAAN